MIKFIRDLLFYPNPFRGRANKWPYSFRIQIMSYGKGWKTDKCITFYLGKEWNGKIKSIYIKNPLR